MKHQWFGLRKLFRNKRVVALMYHRVADLETDPWELAVSPAKFEEQIALLTKKFRVITVHELTKQLHNGKVTSDSICITFDDGYKDNFETARPILEKYNCPATFFIATKYVENQLPYWWDELENIILHSPKLLPVLEVSINNESLRFSLEEDGSLTEEQKQKHQSWTWEQEPPTQRCAAYFAIWEKLRPLPFQQIQDMLKSLRSVVQQECPIDSAHYPMTQDQLSNLGRHPLFTIGLHTHTHPALMFHPREVQLKEIAENKQKLESLLNYTVDNFTYPYGIYDDTTLSVCSELKLKTTFTTNANCISNQSLPFKLGRVQVQNLHGTALVNHISRFFN